MTKAHYCSPKYRKYWEQLKEHPNTWITYPGLDPSMTKRFIKALVNAKYADLEFKSNNPNAKIIAKHGTELKLILLLDRRLEILTTEVKKNG